MDRQDQTTGEVLQGCFYDILRHAGLQIPPHKMEQVRDACDNLGEKFSRMFQRDAIEVAKKLQQATIAAFEGFEGELEKLGTRVSNLENLRTSDVEVPNNTESSEELL